MPIDDRAYASTWFTMSEKVNTIVKVEYTIFQLLSDIGGFAIIVFFVISVLVSPIQAHSMNLTLAESLIKV